MYNLDIYYFDDNKNLLVDELYDFNNEIKNFLLK